LSTELRATFVRTQFVASCELPDRPIVVTRLTAWIEGTNELVDADEVSRTALLWPGTGAEKAAKMVRQDLADARAVWLKEVE